MLEAAGFDFRSHHPQRLVLKLVKSLSYPRDPVGKTAYNMSLDLYRTFAPLKQTTATVAIACVELAARLCDADVAKLSGERGIRYRRWGSSRREVMETLLDLLDLYTHHRPSTLVGPSWPLDGFINIRITLNQEAATHDYPRYTQSAAAATSKKPDKTATNGVAKNGEKSAAATNGAADTSPAAAVLAIGGRGQIGTVRFMLDAARARGEKRTVESFFTAEEEEVEVEVEVERPKRSR